MPIHFAQKLARRVFDYFHYYATDSASTVPDILGSWERYRNDRKGGYKVDRVLRAVIEKLFFKSNDTLKSSQFDEKHIEGSVEAEPHNRADSPIGNYWKDEAELNEQKEIDLINSISSSPWQGELSQKMFYL